MTTTTTQTTTRPIIYKPRLRFTKPHWLFTALAAGLLMWAAIGLGVWWVVCAIFG